MHGFLNINKPAGMTSHDVVARLRRLAGRGVKVGHAGTLDPAATGVLPVALGHATRLIEYLTEARKGYRALVQLGSTTTTDDAEGEVLEQRPVPALDSAALEAVLSRFRGAIMQVPPMYSALHHQGKRLYELAREGKTVELEPRLVTIYSLQLAVGSWQSLLSSGSVLPGNEAQSAICNLQSAICIDVECSKGTYIRSLARDIGVALGFGAHLAALERTFVGAFRVEESVTLAELETNPARLTERMLPPELAVADWPAVSLTEAQWGRVRNGLPLRLPALPGEQARAHGLDGRLVALLRRAGEEWKPEKVFVN
ncbi:MAG: tRNA pseudouridine(55) synthase TruB [Chloroflexaceae bacterium]|jgi:tRNA pseudouridine55 synthase|nr:tRNA pseudouridine(55) synthase TruB [Chloroflexaceae bacterium]